MLWHSDERIVSCKVWIGSKASYIIDSKVVHDFY
jgi:hypothetical protein